MPPKKVTISPRQFDPRLMRWVEPPPPPLPSPPLPPPPKAKKMSWKEEQEAAIEAAITILRIHPLPAVGLRQELANLGYPMSCVVWLLGDMMRRGIVHQLPRLNGAYWPRYALTESIPNETS